MMVGGNMQGILTATLILLVISTPAGNANAGEITTADQATKRALTFFRDVGWVVSADDPPKTEFPANERFDNAWQVKIGRLEAYVDAGNGTVPYASGAGGYGRKPQRVLAITASDAMNLAEKYLSAAGISLGEFGITRSAYEEEADKWTISLHRCYKGYRFHSDFMVMHLLPKDGELDGFGFRFESELPILPDNKLDKDQAYGKAGEYMAQMVAPLGNLQDAELQIVQPDRKWEYIEAGVRPPKSKKSRLAWVMRFDAPWAITEVWVDAENGDVLGGAESMSPAKGKPAIRIHIPALPDMKSVVLTPISSPSKAKTLSAEQDDGLKLLGSIRQLQRLEAKVSVDLPIQLKFEGRDRTYLFGYSAEAHCLTLIKKTFKGGTIDGNLAWETTKEFEDLIAKYIPPPQP